MKKKRSDTDIMIDLLEEATRRSYSDEPFKLREYGPEELPIVLNLIESGYVHGTTTHAGHGPVRWLGGHNAAWPSIARRANRQAGCQEA